MWGKLWERSQMTPQTKATFAHSIQVAIASLPPAQAAAIREKAGAAWLQISQAPSIAWIDEVPYNALTGAAREVLGDAAMRELFRFLGRRVTHTVSFQQLMEGAIRLMGLSPHTLLKVMPRGRESVVRNSGTMTYERVSARCARLRLRDFPPSTYSSGTTVILLAGTMLGLVDLAGYSASVKVDLEDVDLQNGHTTFVVSW